jgi:hypothetical protein
MTIAGSSSREARFKTQVHHAVAAIAAILALAIGYVSLVS